MPISSAAVPAIMSALEESDTLLAVLEAAPGAMPSIREAGGAWLPFAGRDAAGMEGQAWSALADPATAAGQDVQAAFAAGRAYRGDLACRDRAGEQKWLGLHLMPVPAVNGTRRAVLIGRDITRRRHEAAEQRLVQGLLLKSFQASEIPMAIVAPDDRVMLANPQLENLLGRATGGLTGAPFLEQILPPYRQLFLDARAGQELAGPGPTADIELSAGGDVCVAVRASFKPIQCGDDQRFTIMSISRHPEGEVLPARLRMAGKIRFVSLADVRAAAPGRWEAMAARALPAAEAIIRRRLQPKDLLSRTADDGFAICFVDATEAVASNVAAAIARDLQQQLIGPDTGANAVGLTAVVSQVATPAAGKPDMASIARHMERAEAAVSASDWPAPVPVPIVTTADGASAGCLLRIVAPRGAGAAQAFPESRDDIELAALHGAAKVALQNSVLVDVSFSTFLQKARTEAYLEVCAALPAQLRERLYLIFSPMPAGTTQAVVQEAMRRIGRLCAGFGTRLDALLPPELDLAVCRPAMAVVDMAPWDGGGAVPAGRMRRLTSLMHAYRVRVLAQNVLNAEVGRALGGLGVDWMTTRGD